MTNTWVHGVESNFCNASSVLHPECLQEPVVDKKGNLFPEGEALSHDLLMSLQGRVSRAEKLRTWEPDCDGVSDEGSYPSVPSSGSTDTDVGDWSYSEESDHCRGHVVDLGVAGGSVPGHDTGSFETCDVAEDAGPLAGSKLTPCAGGLIGLDKLSCGLDLQQDGGGEFFDTEESPVWARQLGNQCSASSSPHNEDTANVAKQRLPVGRCKDPGLISQEMDLYSTKDLVSLVQCPAPLFRRTAEAACDPGESPVKTPGEFVTMADANRTSSSYASFLQSNDHIIRPHRGGHADVDFRDLEAGFEAGSVLPFKDGRKGPTRNALEKDAVADFLGPGPLINHTSGSDFGKIFLSHIPEHDLNVTKGISLQTDGRSNGHTSEREDGEIPSLRRRRGSRVDSAKGSGAGEPQGARVALPVDNSAVLAAPENGHEIKKPEKKSAKQSKARLTPAEKEAAGMASVKLTSNTRRVGGDVPPLEDIRSKEQAESDRKVQESLDNFIRQTMGREPYMSFRSGDRPIPRLHRSELDANTGKLNKGVGTDMRDAGTDEHTSAVDSEPFRDSSTGNVRAGLGRGLPLSDQLPGWPLLSPPSSKLQMQKCQKCSREFCSVINFRRHSRTHKKIFDADKEDWSKERAKIASFWERLSSGDCKALVGNPSEEESSEEYSAKKVVSALSTCVPQVSLPASYQKAGAALLDIVQSNGAQFILSSEKLFSILDDASEKTFLIGSTDPKDQKVFSGDEKIGLEDQNLVSFLGFFVEQKLMKAWMKDKDEEALKWQHALVAEEEAAQQKLAKSQEKKRMKKAKKGLKEKVRKENVSSLVLPGVETQLLEDAGTGQGLGVHEDSPRSGASSVGSSAEVGELGVHFDRKYEEEVVAPADDAAPRFEEADQDEGACQVLQSDAKPAALEEKPVVGDGGVVEKQQASIFDEELLLKGGRAEEKDVSSVSEVVGKDRDEGLEMSLTTASSGHPGKVQTELQASSNTIQLEQEKGVSEFKRREADRNLPERRFVRPIRVRPESSDGATSSGFPRSNRLSEGRYPENAVQVNNFRQVRKPTGSSHSTRSDTGLYNAPDSSVQPRSQHYRTKSAGSSRSAMPMGSLQHGVWTVKANQPVATDLKERKDEEIGIKDDAVLTRISSAELVEVTEASIAAGPTEVSISKPVHAEKEQVADDRKELAVSSGLVEQTPSASVEHPITPFNLDVNAEDWPRLPQKSATQAPTGSTGEVGSQGLLSGFGLRSSDRLVERNDLSSVCDARTLTSDGRDFNRASRQEFAEEGQPDVMSGALLVGSLSVPLGNFTTDAAFSVSRGESVAKEGIVSDASGAGERGEHNGHSGIPLSGPAKQGSWPLGANRFGSAKVWRAVGAVGDRQEPSVIGSVPGSDTFPTNRDVHGEPEGASVETSFRIEWTPESVGSDVLSRKNGGESLGGSTLATEDGKTETPGSVDGVSRQEYHHRPLLVVNQLVREYVALISDFNQRRWEEVQSDPDAVRDLDAALHQGSWGENEHKVDFLKLVWERRNEWLASRGTDSMGGLQGPPANFGEERPIPIPADQADGVTPGSEPDQTWAQKVEDESSCDGVGGAEGRLASGSQHIPETTVIVTTSIDGELAAGGESASTSVGSGGSEKQGDQTRVPSSNMAQGRGSNRQERWSSQNSKDRVPESSGLRYIARRRA